MGTDTPLAVLSDKAKLLYNYFKQNFAQVTNPPIDPIREELVMSLVSMIGPRPNLLGHHAGNHYRLEVSQPILTNSDLEKIRDIENLAGGAFRTQTIDTTWPASEGAEGMERGGRARLPRGDRRGAGRLHHPDPVGPRGRAGSHSDPGAAGDRGDAHHLIRQGLRTQHRAGGGNRRSARSASFLRARRLRRGGDQSLPGVRDAGADPARKTKLRLSAYDVRKNYLKALGKGIMKVMSKMGISTYHSYCGAQIFDAVGLSSAFVEKCFTGTATTIEGVGFKEIAEEAVTRHRNAYGDRSAVPRSCWMSAATTSSGCAARRTRGRRN